MKEMKSNKKVLKITYILLACIVAFGATLLNIYSDIEFSILVNKISSKPFDVFFGVITHFGLGGLLAILAVLFLFIKYYYSILFIGVLACSGIISYVFKKILFKTSMRPLHYMADMPLRYPEGMEAHFKYSFPSGHTMTIFAAAFLLFWTYRSYRVALITYTIAIIVGISRIYLFQHFLIDVYFGAILGITESLLIVWIMENKFKLHQSRVLNQSLSPIAKRILLSPFKNKRLFPKYYYQRIK